MLRRLIAFLKRTLLPQGSVTGLAVTGGIWATLINVADRVLRLGMLAVLANYLHPSDFGVMGIALVTLGALRQFSNMGLENSLIQQSDDNVDSYLNTVWVMQIGRGLLIAAVMYVSAPYVATFFSEPRAVDILRVLGLSPLLTGLRNPGVVYLKKRMEFHKRFIYQISGSTFNVASAIAFAIVFQNVWALVIGVLAERFAKGLSSYYLHDYRPSLGFDAGRAREMYGFGRWITLSAILMFLFSSGDDAFLGWFVGATALGYYQMAYRFSNAPATEVTHIISQVAFPAYSMVQDDMEKLREGFFKTLQLTTFVSFPMAAGIVVVAPTFVRAFFGTQWLPMVLAMQIMAVYGASRSFGATFGSLFQAVGRPDLGTKLQVLNVALLAVLIYPLTDRFGMEGTALAVLGVTFLTPIQIYLAMQTIDGSYRRFLRILSYPTAGSVAMAAIVWIVQQQVSVGVPMAEFVLLVLTGIGVYAVAILGVERWFDYGINSLLRTMKESVT